MKNKALAIKDEMTSLRRHFHQFPEMGYREFKTSARVREELEKLGLSCTGIARTGLVADLKKGEGPTVLVRADMDALPVQEETDLPFASQVPGCMHACGHDVHTAVLLGVVKLLRDEEFSGTFRFFFQPSEEGNYDDPDGFSGARRACAEGLLQGVDAALGLHQLSVVPTGKIVLTPKAAFAATDLFEIVVHGKAAHGGAMPEKGIDAILVASELVQTLNTVVARNISPQQTAVISIGTIEGGDAPNIVADTVRITGNIRALDEGVHKRIHELIEQRCAGVAAAHGAKIDFTVTLDIPVTYNDERMTALAQEAARKVAGADAVIADMPSMGGEDFAFIAQRVPSAFAFLGTHKPGTEAIPMHNAKMVVDEDALPIGAAYLSQAALDILRALAQK
ncbi:M20 metallopeptidase family protein [Desulfobaculum bizertense]|uniref:Peptidase dimerisation domain-containing protein n=1 Tax=Desulfobaculum bizertense DSM 18034 TaxID=1121442 RepID=A0A1T4WZ41_9BACT|nr:M20 family metallopeptidase [Desulfobaculum bizertense]SKA82653.1 Peptidase dimerisation domain-containing protein [Desulfobaculum bizertense DSM 18034]